MTWPIVWIVGRVKIFRVLCDTNILQPLGAYLILYTLFITIIVGSVLCTNDIQYILNFRQKFIMTMSDIMLSENFDYVFATL